jgi:pyruvate/2-oxoglutarate dehydrogenase complex dihydrolipoamide acyltransferase (E2) component
MTSILEELAAGRIDAAEAARRIDALKAAESTGDEPTADEATAEVTTEPSNEQLADRTAGDADSDPWAAATDRPQHATYRTEPFTAPASEPREEPARRKPVNTSGVERISVRAVGRRVRIIGETSVATLSADGPHVLRRNGSVLEVSSDGELGASLDGFSILRAPRSLDDFRSLGLGKELFLRVNPNIVLDVEVTAGSLNTERVPHLGKIRVTAGAAKMLDVAEINDALIQAGQATIKGSIKTGRNRIRAESGSLSITLHDDSNVTVKSEAQLGRVSWSGAHTGAGDEVVMGNGSARLDVEVVMGHAAVRAGSDQPAETGAE